MYSRWQLGLKAVKTLVAAGLDLRAAARSEGISIGGLAARAMVCFALPLGLAGVLLLEDALRAAIGLVYWPWSMKVAA